MLYRDYPHLIRISLSRNAGSPEDVPGKIAYHRTGKMLCDSLHICLYSLPLLQWLFKPKYLHRIYGLPYPLQSGFRGQVHSLDSLLTQPACQLVGPCLHAPENHAVLQIKKYFPARKTLPRVPSGTYGRYTIYRII